MACLSQTITVSDCHNVIVIVYNRYMSSCPYQFDSTMSSLCPSPYVLFVPVPPRFSALASTTVMTSDPTPRVIITSDSLPQTMTSDPPPLMVTSDPPRLVYTEPKTPVRPSASPSQFSLAAVVRCPVAVETNVAVNTGDCVVSAGVDSDTVVSMVIGGVDSVSPTQSGQGEHVQPH